MQNSQVKRAIQNSANSTKANEYENSMKPTLIFLLLESCILLVAQKVYDYLGCWKDNNSIPQIRFTPPEQQSYILLLRQCSKAAYSRGFPVFGVVNNSACVGSVHGALTYMRYGTSTKCHNGTGGLNAMDVYSLDGMTGSKSLFYEEDQEKRNFISDLYNSAYGDHVSNNVMGALNNALNQNTVIPANAARHPLVKNGRVKPLMLQPLFKEIDERDFGAYRPPTGGINILTNPGFEQPLVNDPIKGWSCQGETDDPRGGYIARYSRQRPKEGIHSGICLARLSEWAGPGQYIGNRVLPGRVYKFMGWTRLLDRKKTGDVHSLELWIRFKKRGDKKQKSKRLAKRTKYSQDYGWVRWHTAFEMPAAKAGFQYMFIYFKGPKPTVDILLDDLYLGEVLQRPDWKEHSDAHIDKYRKRNVRLRYVSLQGSFNYKISDEAVDFLQTHNFMQWDVNNEMLHGSFFADREGVTIRDWMYQAAARAEPDVDLFINDFDVVENGQLTQALLEEAKDLLLRGIPLDGIGVQGHFTGHVNPSLLQYRLNMLSEARIPIWLTEVDVLEKDPVKRADSLETVMRTAFSTPGVQGLILWSFWDHSSWRGPYTSLVEGNDWKINAAGLRYRSLLKQWTTHLAISATSIDQSDAYFDFRGFLGDYEVFLHLPNGQNVTHTFTLDPGNGQLHINVPLPVSTIVKSSSQAASKFPTDAHFTPNAPQFTFNQVQPGFKDFSDEDEQEKDDEFPESKEVSQSKLTDTFRSSIGAYVGCFHNSDPLQQLKHRYEGHPAMVPDICVDHCGSNGFTFAGLLMASECLCGFYFSRESKVRNEECMLPCQGDYERSCGGQKYIAIYSTS
ncbi:Endo-1,4-beta-xylanase [Stylophora pistillata]|uniref:Endo-1,4-beta-xylanase n=1 Tax=Stylophora pistillata TaxID=50429 RepID=A0A2B4SBF3_STYPI|nr:Endo-1,4-beta-xylanase [Stylophora pistillata]